ncbi:MAG: hypothetical protein U1F76_28250 [Candidatus Competibacteraceae bacterium]
MRVLQIATTVPDILRDSASFVPVTTSASNRSCHISTSISSSKARLCSTSRLSFSGSSSSCRRLALAVCNQF